MGYPTHCPRGHEYTYDNISWVITASGNKTGRKCKACLRQRSQANREKSPTYGQPRKVRPVLTVIGPSIAYVELTRGYWSCIEVDDIPLVEKRDWLAVLSDGLPYATSRKGKMHRLIGKATDDVMIDHANRNTLDNRRHNLRHANGSQNMANRIVSKRRTGMYLGVTWHRNTTDKCWRARLGQKTLGYFATPEAARDSYNAAKPEFYGEFARLS